MNFKKFTVFIPGRLTASFRNQESHCHYHKPTNCPWKILFFFLCTQILLVRNPDLNIRTFSHCFFCRFGVSRDRGKYHSLSLKISSHFQSERIWVSGLSVTPVLCRGHMSQMSHSTVERSLLWRWSPWPGLNTLTISS